MTGWIYFLQREKEKKRESEKSNFLQREKEKKKKREKV
jgi:hypothetical protein